MAYTNFEAVLWAFKTPLNHVEKSVLMALAMRVNNNLQCFPYVSELAKDFGISARSVSRALSKLKAGNLISVELQKALVGVANTSSCYTLKMPSAARMKTSMGVTESRGGGDRESSRSRHSGGWVVTESRGGGDRESWISKDSKEESISQFMTTDGLTTAMPAEKQTGNGIPSDWRPAPEHRRIAMVNGIDVNAAEITFRKRKTPIAGDVNAAFLAWMRGAKQRGFAKSEKPSAVVVSNPPPRPGAISHEEAVWLGL